MRRRFPPSNKSLHFFTHSLLSTKQFSREDIIWPHHTMRQCKLFSWGEGWGIGEWGIVCSNTALRLLQAAQFSLFQVVEVPGLLPEQTAPIRRKSVSCRLRRVKAVRMC